MNSYQIKKDLLKKVKCPKNLPKKVYDDKQKKEVPGSNLEVSIVTNVLRSMPDMSLN